MVLPALKKQGLQPCVYCLTHPGTLAPQLQKHDIPVIGPWWQYSKTSSVITKCLGLVLSAIKLATTIRKQHPDIIHFFLPQAYLIGGLISLCVGPNIRIMSRRSLNHYQSRFPIASRVEWWLHKHMDALLTNSLAAAHNLRQETSTSEQLGLIYNGIQQTQFKRQNNAQREAREALAIPSDTLVLVMVANLIPYKGHIDLIQAASQVKWPSDAWQIICIGAGDPTYQSELEQLSQDLKLKKHLQFIGSQQQIAPWLHAADIGVLVSHEEGFSNALLEYMAAGLAVIATDVGGNREAVDNVGCLIPAKNPTAIADAIHQLLSPQQRQAYVQKSLKRAGVFELNTCASHYHDAYSSLKTTGMLPKRIAINDSMLDAYKTSSVGDDICVE